MLNQVLETSEYLGQTYWKDRTTYVFKTIIARKPAYVLAVMQDDKNIYLHSVTQSDNVLLNNQ